MGSVLEHLFVEPATLPEDGYGMFQLLFLGGVYGYVLLTASNMISDGSELLMLTSWAGLVGPVVLPILGAVPDGAIIMFSGATQGKLAVGVGALAGSTIMLLTVPWALALAAARVRCDPTSGDPTYRLTPRASPGPWYTQLYDHGAAVKPSIHSMGWFMLASSVSYLVIQIPSVRFGCESPGCGCVAAGGGVDQTCLAGVAAGERTWAMLGLGASVLLFVGYLSWQAASQLGAERQETKTKQTANKQLLLKSGMLNLRGINKNEPQVAKALKDQGFLQNKFNDFDTDKNGSIDMTEWGDLSKYLSASSDPEEAKQLLLLFQSEQRQSGNNSISRKVFEKVMNDWMDGAVSLDSKRELGHPGAAAAAARGAHAADDDDDEEDDEELEMPEEVEALPEDKRIRRIWALALQGMLCGTALVLVFADPMVGILSALGTRTGIPPFYISFVLAPLASNASELVAAMNYGAKKTKGTFSTALENLLGAACMNNTFCLAIFLYQIIANQLIWEFTAETLSIIFIELCMFGFAQKQYHLVWQAPIVMSLFPLSLVLVYVCENHLGLD